MEFIIHAMQLATENVEVQSAGVTPSSEHIQQEHVQEQVNNTFESTLLRSFEELTAKLASLKQDVKNEHATRSSQGRTFKIYCWSCGCCTPWGEGCDSQKYRHTNDDNLRPERE